MNFTKRPIWEWTDIFPWEIYGQFDQWDLWLFSINSNSGKMHFNTRLCYNEKRESSFFDLSFNWESQQFRHGLVVRIAGSHPAGPGSIPGAGTYLFFLLTAILIIRTNQKTLNNHQIQEWGNLISFEVLRHFTFGRENFPSFRDLKMLDYSRVIHPFTVENEM